MKKLGPGDDLEMMSDTWQWPQWPLLPLKRTKRGPDGFPLECGFLMDAESYRHTIFIGYIWGFKSGTTLKDIVDDPNIKQLKYNSFEEILADGWIVD